MGKSSPEREMQGLRPQSWSEPNIFREDQWESELKGYEGDWTCNGNRMDLVII